MNKKLVALCACPMGLAHTFMAKRSNRASKKGIRL